MQPGSLAKIIARQAPCPVDPLRRPCRGRGVVDHPARVGASIHAIRDTVEAAIRSFDG
jgi:hypothetical protein